MEKKSKGKTIVIVILILAVLGLGGYIVYDKFLNTEKVEPVKTGENEKDCIEKNSMTEDLAINLGKKLYTEVRDKAYNLCFLGGIYSNTQTCYYSNNGTMVEDATCQKSVISLIMVLLAMILKKTLLKLDLNNLKHL